MRLLEDVSYDLDFRKPRVTCEEGLATIEHVQSIVHADGQRGDGT